MKLEITDLVELELDEAASLLYARWPDNDPLMASNFEQSFMIVINTINQLQVKNFLLDSSGNRNFLSERTYRNIFELLFSGLSQTGLQKMARIKSQYAIIEDKFVCHRRPITEGIGVKFEFRNFETREAAEAWLKL